MLDTELFAFCKQLHYWLQFYSCEPLLLNGWWVEETLRGNFNVDPFRFGHMRNLQFDKSLENWWVEKKKKDMFCVSHLGCLIGISSNMSAPW